MTFSILESYQQTPAEPVDPVQQTLEAFVEAARHSDKPFSVEQLTEMVKAEALHEGFWKQWFSGGLTNGKPTACWKPTWSGWPKRPRAWKSCGSWSSADWRGCVPWTAS